MDNTEQGIFPEEPRTHDWLKEISASTAEEKVNSEFKPWRERLRHSRLAEKAGRLWLLFKSGKLSAFDKAIVVAALLYCISPIDVTPDFIPFAGFLDDLLVVLGVLAYLDGKAE